jgi:fructose/tagatose bisphosphate aldolase
VDAAEQTHSPIIIGFNGEFFSLENRLAAERLSLYAALGKAAAENAKVPCGLIFNECSRERWMLAAIDAGFQLVVPTDPRMPYDDYVRRTKRIVEYAHGRHAAVEAELGELPCGASGHIEGDDSHTDPAMAENFAQATGVDLLAVSVGNVHIHFRGEQELDFDDLCRSAYSLWLLICCLQFNTSIESTTSRPSVERRMTA